MVLNYIKSQSTISPELIDTTSSKKFVYIRKNVTELNTVDELSGETYSCYEYDEAKLTKEEYERYLNESSIVDIQQLRADIDYIFLMAGFEED